MIVTALGDITRAKGMTQLAKETGITRDGLYKTLSPTGNLFQHSAKGYRSVWSKARHCDFHVVS